MKMKNFSYNPSYGKLSKPFGIAAEPFEFDKHMKGVVMLEQNASYQPGGAWPMEVVLHYEDGARRSWRSKLYGTIEQFCIDHAAQLVFTPETWRERVIVTGADGFNRPLFPATLDYKSTLQMCLISALQQQELDFETELTSDPNNSDSPQQRRTRGLRPEYSVGKGYGVGSHLRHGLVIPAANDATLSVDVLNAQARP